jgi:hypothetical protein
MRRPRENFTFYALQCYPAGFASSARRISVNTDGKITDFFEIFYPFFPYPCLQEKTVVAV